MRIPGIAVLPMLGVLALGARQGDAQITVTARFGQPQYEVRVSPYSAGAYGEWRTSYSNWQPVDLYSADGHYYSHAVPGARQVAVYRSQNQYFLPPRDQEFDNVDRRYNYARRPVDGDYDVVEGAASSWGVQAERSWGDEIFVGTYSPEAYGDWRTNSRNWESVTLYNRNGRYYPNVVPGARAVAVYRSVNQYFLPPADDQWKNSDARYDYRRAPTQDDYNNPQRSPGQFARQQPAQRDQAQSVDDRAEVPVTMYSPETHGDWRAGYNQWQTATLYNVNGKYYPTAVPGSRSLMVYRSQNQYFLPPRDRGWTDIDLRYNYKLRPTDDDYTAVQQQPTRRP
jgi:hypothetical protein